MPLTSRVDPGEPAGRRVRILLGQSVPLRDDSHLVANVYLPRAAAGPIPGIVESTPYGRDSGHADGVRLADAGFAYVVADCRGRGDSPGTFRQMVHEASDGYDLVEWAAAQGWCSGDIGMWGGSYSGMNQWATAGACPPHLRTIVPGMAVVLGRDTPKGGIPAWYELAWLALVNGAATASQLGGDTALWQGVSLEHRRLGLPARAMADLVGISTPEWERVAQQPEWGPHWEVLLPATSDLAQVEIPVLSLTGQHDSGLQGALLQHERFWAVASNSARERCHLVVGPWDHVGSFSGSDQVGDLRFGEAAKVDLFELMVAWYRWVLLGAAKPAFLRDRCMVYLAGAEEWRATPACEDVQAGVLIRYLESPGAEHDAFHSGWLRETPAPDGTAGFRSAANDPVTSAIELTARPEAAGGEPNAIMDIAVYNNLYLVASGEDPTNQAFSLAIDGIGVAYHSRVLAQPVDLAGRPELDLWLRLDGTDADLAVLLSEVRADGSAIILSSEVLRLSSGNEAVVVPAPGTPFLVPLRDLRFFARRIAAGSRLRLVVRATASLTMAPPVIDTTVEILHGPGHPSQLRLPASGLTDPDPAARTG